MADDSGLTAGLRASEVAERVARGPGQRRARRAHPHASARSSGPTSSRRSTSCSAALLVVILVVGPLQDALFGVVIVANTADRRSSRRCGRSAPSTASRVLSAPRATVVRDGRRRRDRDQRGGARRPRRAARRATRCVVDGVVRRRRRARGRRVAADRRVRPGGEGRRRRGAVGQLRRRGQRPLPGDHASAREAYASQLAERGPPVHARPLRAAQRHRPHPPHRRLS